LEGAARRPAAESPDPVGAGDVPIAQPASNIIRLAAVIARIRQERFNEGRAEVRLWLI
jgi:hypothetical protein